MIWLLIGVLVFLVLPVVTGMLLSPPFRFEVERDFAHSPEAVWKALNDFAAVPMSGKQCRGSQAVESDNGLPAWEENMGPSVARFRTEASEPPRRLVRHFADSVVPMTMRCEYTLEKAGDGCRLRVEVDGKIENGTWHVPIFRFLVKLLGMGRKGQSNYAAALARHLDAAA